MTRLKRVADWIGVGIVYIVGGTIILGTLAVLLLVLMNPDVLIAIGVLVGLLIFAALAMAGNDKD